MRPRSILLLLGAFAVALGACIDPAWGIQRSAPCGDLDPEMLTAFLRVDPGFEVREIRAWEEHMRFQVEGRHADVPCYVLVSEGEISLVAGTPHFFVGESERARWLDSLDYMSERLSRAFPEIGVWTGDMD